MRQLLVASEYGEPSNYSNEICNRLILRGSQSGRDFCLLLISKKPHRCLDILDIANASRFPTQIHITITGLGGTKIEPHIPPYREVVGETIELLIKGGLIKPETVTLRIDPLIPELISDQMKAVPYILESFAEVGVKNCRISVIDYYLHVRERFRDLGIDVSYKFQAPRYAKDALINKVAYLTTQLNMRLHLCAESLPETAEDLIDVEGCASAESWRRLGINDLVPIVRKQRQECTCDLKKEDLLAGLDKGCKSGCAYCYWR